MRNAAAAARALSSGGESLHELDSEAKARTGRQRPRAPDPGSRLWARAVRVAEGSWLAVLKSFRPSFEAEFAVLE